MGLQDSTFVYTYEQAICDAAESIVAKNITEEEAWETAIREEVDQFGWYCGTDQAYDTLRASAHPNELMDRIGYEDQDIFSLIGMAAAFAIEGDIAAACGDNFYGYRVLVDEAAETG